MGQCKTGPIIGLSMQYFIDTFKNFTEDMFSSSVFSWYLQSLVFQLKGTYIELKTTTCWICHADIRKYHVKYLTWQNILRLQGTTFPICCFLTAKCLLFVCVRTHGSMCGPKNQCNQNSYLLCQSFDYMVVAASWLFLPEPANILAQWKKHKLLKHISKEKRTHADCKLYTKRD